MALHNRGVRQDIRELGALLGDVLKEQTASDAFETVETLRTAAIDYRDGEINSRAELRDTIDQLSPGEEGEVARAFTTYFELINLAEERERVRAVRTGSQEDTLDDSFEQTVKTLTEADVHGESVESILDDVLIEPTFTAHPTEARRRTIKAKLRSIADHLQTLDEHNLTDQEAADVWEDINAEVTSLWQTRQVRQRQPEPQDEARNIQWYLENTLFDVVGEVYSEFGDAVTEEYPDVDIPKLFEFRSWAGSDRDGNPFVTVDVTGETLETQRNIVLERYQTRLKRLSAVLSQDGDRYATTGAFTSSLEADLDRFPAVSEEAKERYPDEPYRQKFGLMRERLDRVGDVRPGGYEESEELLADLETVDASLRAYGGVDIADTYIQPLIRQVDTFSFSLASLDLRDHRIQHTKAVDEALANEGMDYRDLDEDDRVELLTDAILQDKPVLDMESPGELTEESQKVIDRFLALGDWQSEYGVEAIDTYAVSMAEEPSHALEVLFLADQVDVVALPEHVGIDIVPLLETEYALNGADRIMGTLFENEAYGQALEIRGNTQEILLGYSDSNKENGFMAANWDLYNNQRRLAEITDNYGVTMRMFHGRGGSISRGGGPMNRALLALPNETVTGQVKFTEQGEVIAEKYGLPRIAERNLEQMLDAQIRARHNAIEEPIEEVPDAWSDAMNTIADAARKTYQDLLNTDGFVSYFEQATPITVIENLNLGSRPASRSEERSVEDLRAIPWVFSWTQSRCILPGWYSIAAGIDAYLDDGGDLDTLAEMYEEWPFFQTTFDRATIALARTDLEVADEYAALADSDLREEFQPRLEDEYEQTVEYMLEITGRSSLLRREWFEESLERRNPYVDPLNLLQTHLLSQTHLTEAEERTLRLTINGIAAGMKNTG